MNAYAIIVAAGSGTRARSTVPKQWAPFLDGMVADMSVNAFLSHPDVKGVVIVVGSDHENLARSRYADQRMSIVTGGASRAESVRRGLTAVPASAEAILIHDAARPGLTKEVIGALLEALDDHDGAAPALIVIDALKRMSSSTLETVSRDDLYRVQTPQAFRADVIRRALADASKDWVDDLAAAEAIGARLTLTQGSERLMKITTPEDFDRAASLIRRDARFEIRTGSGFDVHAFIPGEFVTLCGVQIPHSHRLEGHSDADAGWHALTDAILGAAALGDIGDHFPPSDPRWKDADSGLFLRHALELVGQDGWRLAHGDVTLITEAPKIKPHREAMRMRTAELLGLSVDRISVKATTTETLGFTGRHEGLAALATATLERWR